jgi:hypothetical protein
VEHQDVQDGEKDVSRERNKSKEREKENIEESQPRPGEYIVEAILGHRYNTHHRRV